ncbi:MAG: hypothetical protein ACOCZ3_03785, partial [Bacillota bacterium]
MSITNFFPGGNTAGGFYSLYEYLYRDSDRIFIIKGGPGTGKSTFMKNLGYSALKQGWEIEFHWCASDNESLDGVVIPGLKIAVVDGTTPHTIDPSLPGAREEILYFGEFWDQQYLQQQTETLLKLTQEIGFAYQQTYNYLKLASLLQQQYDRYYLNCLQPEKLLNIKTYLQNKITYKPSHNRPAPGRHLFASALTPEGEVSFLSELTDQIQQRYLIQGPAQTGSRLLQELGQQVQEIGQQVLFLHHPLNPEQLEAIIIKELRSALINFHRTDLLHQIKEEDQLIDLLETGGYSPGETYSQEIDRDRS